MNHLDFFRAATPFKNYGRDLGKELASQAFFDKFFDDTRWMNAADKESFVPQCQVHETKTAYELKFDLPGIAKENVKIDLHDNRLTVSGERRDEKRSEDKSDGDRRTHLSEVYYGNFMRSFTFPTQVDAEKSEAKFENGVLMVIVNKKDVPQARQITIK